MKQFSKSIGMKIGLLFVDSAIPLARFGNWLFGISYANSDDEFSDAKDLNFGRNWINYSERQMRIIKSLGLDRRLKVFQMNEYEWWCDFTIDEAIDNYLEATGVTEEEGLDDPNELTEEQLKMLTIRVNDDSDKTMTFEQYLTTFNLPGLFATTEG